MSEIHVAGFLALLDDPNVVVDDGESPNSAVLPRVVLFTDQGLSTRATLCTSPDGMYITVQTTCVGETRASAGAMFDKVRALVEDKRPVVAGWVCGPVQELSTQPAIRDDDVDPAVFYAVAKWRFHAVPVSPA